ERFCLLIGRPSNSTPSRDRTSGRALTHSRIGLASSSFCKRRLSCSRSSRGSRAIFPMLLVFFMCLSSHSHNRAHKPSIIGQMSNARTHGTLQVSGGERLAEVWTRPKGGPTLESVNVRQQETANSHE